MNQNNNALWQYSLSVYPALGVEPLLLTLQDDFGLNINILLACCWQGSRGFVLGAEQWLLVVQASANIINECIAPLRSVRRFVGNQPAMKLFYQQVKALELEAERQQQQVIYLQLKSLNLQSSQKEGCSFCVEQNIANYCSGVTSVEWLEIRPLVRSILDVIDLNNA